MCQENINSFRKCFSTTLNHRSLLGLEDEVGYVGDIQTMSGWDSSTPQGEVPKGALPHLCGSQTVLLIFYL